MSITFRQQDLKTLEPDSSNEETQDKADATDIQMYKTLTVQVRKPVAAVGPNTATLYLQHAASLDDDAFVDITSTTFDLKSTTTEVGTFSNLLRYVRWHAVGDAAFSTYPQFMIDIVGRES